MTVEQRLDDEPQEREDRAVENANDLTEVFLRDLTQLSIRYGIVISGCGCCGSPSVTQEKLNPDGHYIIGDRLEWSEPPVFDHPLRHRFQDNGRGGCRKCSQPYDNHQ